MQSHGYSANARLVRYSFLSARLIATNSQIMAIAEANIIVSSLVDCLASNIDKSMIWIADSDFMSLCFSVLRYCGIVAFFARVS